MSPPKCSRIWLVEAVRDGRVTGPERDAFERHLRSCSDCQEESNLIDRLGAALRQLPVHQPDILSVRRQRQRLMAESDAVRMREARSPWPRRVGYSVAIASGFVLVAGLSKKVHQATVAGPTEPTVAVVAAPTQPTIAVLPEAGARWRQRRSGEVSRVELDEGAISLRIQRRAYDGRVLIALPDGEIEDFGTVLRVHVEGGRTVEISVEEGNVAVRLHGRPELRLGAGESWAAEPLAAPEGHAPPSAASATTAPRRPAEASPRARHDSSAQHHIEAESKVASESDAAEDHAYLEIVKLARAGRAPEARALAREYLLRFPNGFRRVEVLDIATVRDAN